MWYFYITCTYVKFDVPLSNFRLVPLAIYNFPTMIFLFALHIAVTGVHTAKGFHLYFVLIVNIESNVNRYIYGLYWKLRAKFVVSMIDEFLGVHFRGIVAARSPGPQF